MLYMSLSELMAQTHGFIYDTHTHTEAHVMLAVFSASERVNTVYLIQVSFIGMTCTVLPKHWHIIHKQT